MELKSIETKIQYQGCILIHEAVIVHESENIKCAVISLMSKRCEASAHNSIENIPIISLHGQKESLRLKEKTDYLDATEVSFPTLKGWKTWQVDSYGKNGIKATFVKDED